MKLFEDFIVSWLINPEELLISSTSTLTWILITGQWRDQGLWDDQATWVD